MNTSQSQASQGSQGTGNQQLIRAEDLQKLQCLTEDQKQKYRVPLVQLWQTLNKPQDSPEYIAARSKLVDWSTKLIQQERLHRQKQAARTQGQPGQPPQQAQASNAQQQTPQQQQAQPQAQAQQQQQQTPQQQPQRPPQPQQQGTANAPNPQANAPQVNPQILKHVQDFPYVLPLQGPQQGTPEGQLKLKEMRNGYLMALNRQEKATIRAKQITALMDQRKQIGQEIPQEFIQQKAQAEQEYMTAKQQVDEFRKRQALWKSELEAVKAKQQQQAQSSQPQQAQQSQSQSQPQPQQSQQNAQPVKQEPQVKVEGGASQQGKPVNSMPAAGPQGQHAGGAQGPASANVVNQQQAVRTSQPPQQPTQAVQFTQPGQSQQPTQQPQRPQINPQQANAHMQQQQQHHSPHPQSANSNAPGIPAPLSHQAAVSAAQRSYSNQEPPRTMTPQQMNQGSFHRGGEREVTNSTKFDIPKRLNVPPPVPVSMGPARPTMSGPTNGAPGMMGQPAMNKWPQFQLEGEGDRVLSKRKLDELVRQVTGGGDGPGGESLSPEVEEIMLQLADDFVDTVITSSCKLSKLRESSTLDVRDIQLVLERNYNIRIPGYASDEIRTVRKLHPAPGWTQKMNAVQAAKVMGGKADI